MVPPLTLTVNFGGGVRDNSETRPFARAPGRASVLPQSWPPEMTAGVDRHSDIPGGAFHIWPNRCHKLAASNPSTSTWAAARAGLGGLSEVTAGKSIGSQGSPSGRTGSSTPGSLRYIPRTHSE